MTVASPRVSVVINNYNYGCFLGAAIDSALAQTYPDVEVVVVDDGSRDHSRAVIAAAGERVVAVLKENGGQASAINAGVARSTGEVILMLDADDLLLPTTAGRVVAALRERPEAAKVHYPLEVVDAAGRPTGDLAPSTPPSAGDLRRQVIERGSYSTPPSSGNAFPRWVLRRLLPIPEQTYRISADEYLTCLAPLLGPVVALDAAGARYRQHDANLYSSSHVRRLDEAFLARLRDNIVYRDASRTLQRRLAQDLGLLSGKPRRGPYLNDVHLRLISLKLDPARHPVPGDRLRSVAWSGLTACLTPSRYPTPAHRWYQRCLRAAWLLAVVMAPRPGAAWLIEQRYVHGAQGWLAGVIWRRRRKVMARREKDPAVRLFSATGRSPKGTA